MGLNIGFIISIIFLVIISSMLIFGYKEIQNVAKVCGGELDLNDCENLKCWADHNSFFIVSYQDEYLKCLQLKDLEERCGK